MLSSSIRFFSRTLQRLSSDLYEQARSNAKIAPLSVLQLQYLDIIQKEGRTTTTWLAEHFAVKKPTVTNLLKSLEEKAVLQKKQSDQDKRIFYWSLTREAEELFEKREEMYHILGQQIEAVLTHEETTELKELLDKVIQRLAKST